MEMSAKKSRSIMSNNSGSGSGSTTTMAVERKEVERRRQQMKSLCVKLASLIPKNLYSSEVMCIRIRVCLISWVNC